MGEKKHIFETIPVPKALATLAIPSVISQLIALVYNIADTFFIGKTNDPYKIAAVTLLYVLVAIMNGLSNLFGVGGGSLISRLMGAKDEGGAKAACAFSFYGSVAIAVLYSLGCFLFMDPLLRLMGASRYTMDYASSYVFYVIVLGGLPSTLSMTMAHLLRSEGYAKQASFGLGMGGILNIILDPLFMFVLLEPGLEVTGAAVATMLSNLCSLLYFLVLFVRLRGRTSLSLSFRLAPAGAQYAGKILSVGFPSALNTFLSCICILLMNALAATYGDIPVAAMGIVKKIDMLPMNVGMGLCQGMMPLVAYNYAAKNYKRMKAAADCARACGMGFALLCILCYETFAGPIISLFINEAETQALGIPFLRICCLAVPLMVCNFQMTYMLQAMGKGHTSLLLTFCRQGLFTIPAIFLLNHWFGLYGVVWSQGVADTLTIVVALILLKAQCREIVPGTEPSKA